MLLYSIVYMLTVFDVVQGKGYHISIDGVQVLSTQWNNISLQTFQVRTTWINLVYFSC